MRDSADTIFAVASGGMRAAVTVLRLSGPRTGWLLDQIAGGRGTARQARLRRLRDSDGATLDHALVLWFPGPASYTGEDCGELHLHGGRAVAQDVAEALAGLGARPAEPGEFTRRAFLNGKMDLLEAEAIADLVEAETTAQRRQALRQLDGALAALYSGWSARLTRLLAWLEALIDFPDEDLPAGVAADAAAALDELRAELTAHLQDGRRGERLREGLVFAVVGAPNAGKSTLINALAERDAAIVAATEGTTRDILEVRVVLAGVPVTLLDTAGLRETCDPVEAEGVRRARARAAEADLVVEVIDPLQTPLPADVGPHGQRRIRVASKCDLGPPRDATDVAVSGLTGEGMSALRDRLAIEARTMTSLLGAPPLTRARHRAALTAALARLDAAAAARLPELCGEDLRAARYEIGRITGHVGVDGILDAVFRDFCIGK